MNRMMSNRPVVVVLDDWENGLRDTTDWDTISTNAELTIHNVRLRGRDLLTALEDADVVVLFRDRTSFDAGLIAQLPKLRHIVCTGARNRTLDAQAAEAAGIRISHTEWGPSKASTCELTWALILAAARRLPHIALSLRKNTWRDPDVSTFLAPVLEGKRLGLVGLGQIGQRVAAVAKAFGMEVVTWSPNMTKERAAEHSVTAVPLEELLGASHVVSLHLVPTPATRHLLNRERLAWMAPSSILVNTSRAELIDTAALVETLQRQEIAYCALDVFDEEPIRADHPLLKMPNALLTPHHGFICDEVIRSFSKGVQEQLETYLSTRKHNTT